MMRINAQLGTRPCWTQLGTDSKCVKNDTKMDSHQGGKMKKLVDENGNVIEGSISEKIWLDTDGTKLGLIIKSENPNNPVLLVLGGGPGIPEYLLEDTYDSHLYKYFTVCYINYRGTGLSYDKNINKESLTSEKYFEDAITVTNYLRGRFNKEKINRYRTII